MPDLTTRYRVRPAFSVVAHSADVVELRRGVWNPVSITLTDRSGSGKLFRALELMTGEATLSEIAERVSITNDEAEKLVLFLNRHDAIEVEPRSAFDAQLDLYRDTLGNGAGGGVKFERAVFLGTADLTEQICTELAELTGELPIERLEPASWTELAETDLTVGEDGLRLRKQLARWEAWKGGLVVFASLTIHPIVLSNVNRICLHYGIPWIHAAADGPFLIIGPTFSPKKSACYECFENRVAMSMRESASYLRYKQALVKRAIKTGSPYLGGPFKGLLASLVAVEVANLITTGSDFTIGKALTVFLPTLEFSFSEVLRLPGCPACSPVTEQFEQGLYFDLKGYVNSLYDGNGAGKR
jgi:bacteriocin biosynthesis cyclodehydratase domain-containing protein